MWMRPSWDSQYTQTETERAKTPYYYYSWVRVALAAYCTTLLVTVYTLYVALVPCRC